MPRFTNRLALETSPYLLQHAHNPVNWYPWGDEAFAVARRLGRPVLLSIGYSTCHWCHVMEEESFEDLEIAEFLNTHYVAIKVDREERPDLDSVYMAAVQALTGRGGWPMTTWLTAQREVFYGGTYFPPRDGVRGTRRGFLSLLSDLHAVYRQSPERVATRSGEITATVQRVLGVASGGGTPTQRVLDRGAEVAQTRFDPVHGGVRGAPKFPSSFPVRWLLQEAAARGVAGAELRRMALKTLDGMADGGIYDHIGGGFHRYAVDAAWRVPHFEKMLYDNAQLMQAYLDGWQVSGEERYAVVVRETVEWVLGRMRSEQGAFFSATDADSATPQGEREEGRFFTWTPDELDQVLGADAGRRFGLAYGITPQGNLEGRSVPYRAVGLDALASRLERPPAELARLLEQDRRRLRSAREIRPEPLRDDKILVSWNGLMIAAMARAARLLNEPSWLQAALEAAEFLHGQLIVDGRLRRSWAAGRLGGDAFLDDHAFLVAAWIELHQATSDPIWLDRALELQRGQDLAFRDVEAGGYFFTRHDHEALLAREKPTRDGAEPSGNAVTLVNLTRLYGLTGDPKWRQLRDAQLNFLGEALRKSPANSGEALRGLGLMLDASREIVLVRGMRDDVGLFEELSEIVRRHYDPRSLWIRLDAEDSAHAKRVPWLRGKRAQRGRTTAYVCTDRVCERPAYDAETFRKQLERTPRPRQKSGGQSLEASEH